MRPSPIRDHARASLKCAAIPCLLLIASACSSGMEPEPCVGEATTLLSHSVCLDLVQAGPVAAYRITLEEEVERTVVAVNALMPIDGIRLRIIADPAQVIPEIGLGGLTTSGGEVKIFADPGVTNLEQVIRAALLPMLAHELHHAKRMRTVGYGSTLIAAVVSEGLADHFSIEVAHVQPPLWSVAVAEPDLHSWTEQVITTKGSYSHTAWFYGTAPGIPRWTGYSVGFELVRLYLAIHPDERASTLFDEPASSFVPTLY